MVVNAKNILIAFLLTGLLFVIEHLYFENAIVKEQNVVEKKRALIEKLTQLESQWSKQRQHEEFQRLEDFLKGFDVHYKTSEKKRSIELSMQLKKTQAEKVIPFLLNRNLNLKAFSIQKQNAKQVLLKVVIEW